MTVEISEWVDAMTDAAIEFAEQMMAIPDCRRGAEPTSLPEGLGAYIALVGDVTSLQIGVIADEASCYLLGRALLMMEPGEELSAADMADAMNEIVNVLAGGVKTRMSDREAGLTLGLPVFIEGHVRPTPAIEWAAGQVNLGGTELGLVVLRQPK